MSRLRTAIRMVAAGILVVLGVYTCWLALYPEEYDPKNVHYVLWKHGLSQNINLDNAVGGMAHDTWAVNLVRGKSRDQLSRRFGYIRTLDQTTPYLRLCYTQPKTVGELGAEPHGKEVVFLRDSPWMVILDRGKGVDLVLCKGY